MLEDRRNWQIAMLFGRQEFSECLVLVNKALEESFGLSEYPLYVKGMILRQQGNVQESLQTFQSAVRLNPTNVTNLKQVGHSLFLLGRHKAALDVYAKAAEVDGERDWEIFHNSGLCQAYLKQYDSAIESFRRANAVGRHDATFLQLGKIYQQQKNDEEALRVYHDALDFSPDNPEILCTIGLAYLRLEDHQKAFDYLGNSLTYDPKNVKAILAAGSIIQDNGEMDVALHKYRVAAVRTPQSPQLWNNIGMALFGKGKHVAAISCLKRALYFDPFEWIVSFNLGLIHLHTKQYASAFHHLSTSINLRSSGGGTTSAMTAEQEGAAAASSLTEYPTAYVYLGVALSNLQDPKNAIEAFKKAISLEDTYSARLNFAIVLYNHGHDSQAKEHFKAYGELAAKKLDANDEQNTDVFERAALLESALAALSS